MLLPIFRLLFALICHVPVYSGSNTCSKAVTVLRWFDMEANFREKALLIQLQMGIWSFMQLHSMEQGPNPCHQNSEFSTSGNIANCYECKWCQVEGPAKLKCKVCVEVLTIIQVSGPPVQLSHN